MPRRKTDKEFTEEVCSLVGSEYTFLEEYVLGKTKISVKHNTCGHEWKVQPNEFLRGSRCPKCSMKLKRRGSKRKTHKQFISEVYGIVGSEYTFLEEYVNDRTRVNVKHNVCRNIYSVTPSSFIQGKRCPKYSRTALKTNEKFREEVFSLTNGEYEFLEKYKGGAKKIKAIHHKCKHEYKVKPNNFMSGHRCPNCRYEKLSKKTRKKKEDFESQVLNLVGFEYELMSEYLGNKKHIKIKHKLCNHTYEVLPTNFLRGTRCPKCRESKGERAVADYLSSEDITHEREYTFDNLTSRGHLRFDFALLDARGRVYALIEYDGIQHFKEVSVWDGEEGLIKRQYHDNLKDEYCLDNGIPLLRIPYWDVNNIDNILDEFLSKRGDYLCQD